jgi:hypothetical protein
VAVAGIDDELDRLYALPLDEFTRERDTLAKQLRSDGRREDAEAIAEARKPVLSAWVVNRLAREREHDVQALVDAAVAIRAGAPGADERFRATVEELVPRARDVLEGEGRRASDTTLREVATTLRAAPVAEPELLTRGRLTQSLETTGFDAMAGAAAGEAPARRTRKRKETRRDDTARLDEARTALATARDEAHELARKAVDAEREARRLRADAEAAERRVAEAEKRLERARRR